MSGEKAGEFSQCLFSVDLVFSGKRARMTPVINNRYDFLRIRKGDNHGDSIAFNETNILDQERYKGYQSAHHGGIARHYYWRLGYSRDGTDSERAREHTRDPSVLSVHRLDGVDQCERQFLDDRQSIEEIDGSGERRGAHPVFALVQIPIQCRD